MKQRSLDKQTREAVKRLIEQSGNTDSFPASCFLPTASCFRCAMIRAHAVDNRIEGGLTRMAEMLVMRRANGDLFTEEINGQPRIPVWSSRAACARYRQRNPELLTYLPARLDDSLIRRITGDFSGEWRAAFFLMSEDAPDAYLDRGRPISVDELLLTDHIVSPPATARG